MPEVETSLARGAISRKLFPLRESTLLGEAFVPHRATRARKVISSVCFAVDPPVDELLRLFYGTNTVASVNT